MHRSKSGSLSHVPSGSFAPDRKAYDSRYVRFAPKADKRVDGSVRQLCAKSGHMQRSKFAFSTIQIQNFIVVPANHVLSAVPTKNPFGWSGLMPYLFFHQR